MTWRVGRKLGRTLYQDDVCIGMVDDALTAECIVDAMNSFRGHVEAAAIVEELVKFLEEHHPTDDYGDCCVFGRAIVWKLKYGGRESIGQ